MTEIDQLTGPELAAAVAEEVMGWRQYIGHDTVAYWRIGPSHAVGYPIHSWRPYSDIAAAWEVHQKMQECLFSVRQRYYYAIQLTVRQRLGMSGMPIWPDVFGLIKPEDICRAALKAKEVSDAK